MEAKREDIFGLLLLEMPIPQIMKEVGISLSTIYRVKNSLKEQGHVKYKPGSGRKPSVVTFGLVSAVKSQIDRNPIRSMRRLTSIFLKQQ